MIFKQGEFPTNKEEIMTSQRMMTSTRLANNVKIGAKKKKATKKKVAAIILVPNGEGESSWLKKGKVKAKNGNNILIGINKTLRQEDKLSTKTRPQDVNEIYKALEIGLMDCFLY